MAFTLQQIFAALAAVENGPNMIADLQQEFTNLRGEAAKHRTDKQKVLQALGIQDGADVDTALNGITSTLDALKSSGKKPDEIGAQMAQLEQKLKTLSDELTAEKQGRQAERDKRIGATKMNKALAALQAGNAANPEMLAKLVMESIVVKDDDSLAYKDGDKELAVEEGITAFLAANPWAVKNTQNPGAGSKPPNGGVPLQSFTKAQIEGMTPDEINKNWDAVQASLQNI